VTKRKIHESAGSINKSFKKTGEAQPGKRTTEKDAKKH
jgi:hypothetical protein